MAVRQLVLGALVAAVASRQVAQATNQSAATAACNQTLGAGLGLSQLRAAGELTAACRETAPAASGAAESDGAAPSLPPATALELQQGCLEDGLEAVAHRVERARAKLLGQCESAAAAAVLEHGADASASELSKYAEAAATSAMEAQSGELQAHLTAIVSQQTVATQLLAQKALMDFVKKADTQLETLHIAMSERLKDGSVTEKQMAALMEETMGKVMGPGAGSATAEELEAAVKKALAQMSLLAAAAGGAADDGGAASAGGAAGAAAKAACQQELGATLAMLQMRAVGELGAACQEVAPAGSGAAESDGVPGLPPTTAQELQESCLQDGLAAMEARVERTRAKLLGQCESAAAAAVLEHGANASTSEVSKYAEAAATSAVEANGEELEAQFMTIVYRQTVATQTRAQQAMMDFERAVKHQFKILEAAMSKSLKDGSVTEEQMDALMEETMGNVMGPGAGSATAEEMEAAVKKALARLSKLGSSAPSASKLYEVGAAALALGRNPGSPRGPGSPGGRSAWLAFVGLSLAALVMAAAAATGAASTCGVGRPRAAVGASYDAIGLQEHLTVEDGGAAR